MNLDLFKIAAGILLVLLGRRLFWLFVGLIGFWAGIVWSGIFFSNQSPGVQLLFAILCGFIGILLAVFLQRLAIAIAGFFAGGHFALFVIHQSHIISAQYNWLVFVVAGILGAILMSVIFDWALIVLSSAAGSALITEALHLRGSISYLVFLGVLIVGVAIQAGIYSAQKRRAT